MYFRKLVYCILPTLGDVISYFGGGGPEIRALKNKPVRRTNRSGLEKSFLETNNSKAKGLNDPMALRKAKI